jgi:hypothetical protein
VKLSDHYPVLGRYEIGGIKEVKKNGQQKLADQKSIKKKP